MFNSSITNNKVNEFTSQTKNENQNHHLYTHSNCVQLTTQDTQEKTQETLYRNKSNFPNKTLFGAYMDSKGIFR